MVSSPEKGGEREDQRVLLFFRRIQNTARATRALMGEPLVDWSNPIRNRGREPYNIRGSAKNVQRGEGRHYLGPVFSDEWSCTLLHLLSGYERVKAGCVGGTAPFNSRYPEGKGIRQEYK